MHAQRARLQLGSSSGAMGRHMGGRRDGETVRRAQAAVAAATSGGDDAPNVVSARPIQSLWAGEPAEAGELDATWVAQIERSKLC